MENHNQINAEKYWKDFQRKFKAILNTYPDDSRDKKFKALVTWIQKTIQQETGDNIPADDLKNELTVLIAKLDKENQRLLEYLAVEQSLQEKQRQMPPIDFDNLHTLLKNNYNAGLNTRYTEFLNEIFGHEVGRNPINPEWISKKLKDIKENLKSTSTKLKTIYIPIFRNIDTNILCELLTDTKLVPKRKGRAHKGLDKVLDSTSHEVWKHYLLSPYSIKEYHQKDVDYDMIDVNQEIQRVKRNIYISDGISGLHLFNTIASELLESIRKIDFELSNIGLSYDSVTDRKSLMSNKLNLCYLHAFRPLPNDFPNDAMCRDTDIITVSQLHNSFYALFEELASILESVQTVPGRDLLSHILSNFANKISIFDYVIRNYLNLFPAINPLPLDFLKPDLSFHSLYKEIIMTLKKSGKSKLNPALSSPSGYTPYECFCIYTMIHLNNWNREETDNWGCKDWVIYKTHNAMKESGWGIDWNQYLTGNLLPPQWSIDRNQAMPHVNSDKCNSVYNVKFSKASELLFILKDLPYDNTCTTDELWTDFIKQKEKNPLSFIYQNFFDETKDALTLTTGIQQFLQLDILSRKNFNPEEPYNKTIRQIADKFIITTFNRKDFRAALSIPSDEKDYTQSSIQGLTMTDYKNIFVLKYILATEQENIFPNQFSEKETYNRIKVLADSNKKSNLLRAFCKVATQIATEVSNANTCDSDLAEGVFQLTVCKLIFKKYGKMNFNLTEDTMHDVNSWTLSDAQVVFKFQFALRYFGYINKYKDVLSIEPKVDLSDKINFLAKKIKEDVSIKEQIDWDTAISKYKDSIDRKIIVSIDPFNFYFFLHLFPLSNAIHTRDDKRFMQNSSIASIKKKDNISSSGRYYTLMDFFNKDKNSYDVSKADEFACHSINALLFMRKLSLLPDHYQKEFCAFIETLKKSLTKH